jgi:CRP/FNR family cyclic AMP-dependent transcriptional regulator
MKTEAGQVVINLTKDQVLCREGDNENDLFIIHEGKLMICMQKGSQITPLAYLGAGQYLGELSFFDKEPRSATVICVEDTTIIKISSKELKNQFPPWLENCSQSITKRIRGLDAVIRETGIRRTNVGTVKPLSMEEKKHYFDILK